MALNLKRGSELYHLRSRVVKFIPNHETKRRRSISLRSTYDDDHDNHEKKVKCRGEPTFEDYVAYSEGLAKKALHHFNHNRGQQVPEYELVRPLDYEVAISRRGILYHVNFEAKRRDDPEAQVEVFFSELYSYRVLLCCSLGTSPSESGAVGKDICLFCRRIKHTKDYDGFGSPSYDHDL